MGATQSTSRIFMKDTTELLVYGYLRDIEHTLHIDIPQVIYVLLCNLYEANALNRWDTKYTFPCFTISDDDTLITFDAANQIPAYQKGGYYTAYTQHVIQRGDYYRCKLQIANINGMAHFYVGLVPNDYNMTTEYYVLSRSWIEFLYSDGNAYLYNCTSASFCSPDSRGHFNSREVGAPCHKTGDTIECIVDLTANNASIGYVINGTDYGVFSEQISSKSSYRFVVTFYSISNNAQLRILK